MTKRVFVTEHLGLSKRLEALAMAFLISERFGHEVCLDWPELDALRIEGARRTRRGLLGRIDSIKLRHYSAAAFQQIGQHRNIVLCTHEGPREWLEPLYLPTARRVRLRGDLTETIRRTFARHGDRPIVGVHIRRGDFSLVSEDRFDVNAAERAAVPDWWYAHVMGEIQRAHPDVAFFVSCTGSLVDYPFLAAFDVFELPTRFPYRHRRPSHAARRHPAADLWALGGCSVIVGTPCSTFSHYAADMLGAASVLLVPPATPTARSAPAYARLDLHGRGAFDFYAACRTGAGQKPVLDAATLPITRGASVGWM